MAKVKKLDTTQLFAELDRISEASDTSRTWAAWQVLQLAASADDYRVATDYALERNLIPMSYLAQPDHPPVGPLQNMFTLNEVDNSQMVWIPPGPFLAGDENQQLDAAGFYLARFPVTNRQFQQFLDATQYTPPAGDPLADDFLKHWDGGKVPHKQEEHPVVWVSLVDAAAYCRWAGLSLPSEWLWEKAARGTDGREFPWGETPNGRIESMTNVAAKSTVEVGKYPRTRTAFGCEDMVGNVSEWCLASEVPTAKLPAGLPIVDLSNPDPQQAVVRGSCYLRNLQRYMVCHHRRRLSPIRRNHWVGFRPAAFSL